MAPKKYVYFFGNGKAEGNASQKHLLGGKGANLAEMTSIGLPVPPGFTISTEACQYYIEHNGAWPEGLKEEVQENLQKLEQLMGLKLGDPAKPLLVSVRSGAAVSMPGMMDTVLNLGLTREVLDGLIRRTNNPRFAWDSYRRFIQMFGDVVMGVPHDEFEHALENVKHERGKKLDTELSVEDLQEVVKRYLAIYKKYIHEDFPQDAHDQLTKAINAVFNSWNNERAIKYRQLHDIRGLLGTAVNVQSMVFGNMGETSGTGVAFTRDPATGENKFYGEFLMNAQGEDVVAGIRTPVSIDKLKDVNPAAYQQLLEIRTILERHYRDMQDIEFTIQEGKLYMLQTRNAKRTIFSWVRSQVEMVKEGLITKEEAVKRIPASEFNKLFAPILDPADIKAKGVKPIAKGLNASPGGACGQVVFTAEDAEKWAAQKKNVILVRIETSPEDIGGMAVAKGILTARGGMTSHAAVVARGMGCPCVAGAGDLIINYSKKEMTVHNQIIREGDYIAIDGFTGDIYACAINVKPSEIVQVLEGQMKPQDSLLYQNYATLMQWVDEIRQIGVWTNADTPKDAEVAVRFGAEGIGLCRTEHMFFEGDRIIAMREMILADTLEARERALAKLLPMQQGDFEGIFRVLKGRPATIRLIDPPLHEFLPHDRKGQQEVAKQLGVKLKKVKETVDALHEFNPMLGFRGCRLIIVYPEILRMQVRAIIQAALNVQKEGIPVKPEIMIPLVGNVKELAYCRRIAEDEIKKIFAERKETVHYSIGTMIEVPRAAITADEIAKEADFFSFGTNDLTQMTCGFSRDDAGRFLIPYVEDKDKQFYDYDPFQVIDFGGVGKLMEMAVKLGRQTKPNLKIGICGEHGGEPKSVAFCHNIGFDYVSCSPYRVAVARLAAAQAAIAKPRKPAGTCCCCSGD